MTSIFAKIVVQDQIDIKTGFSHKDTPIQVIAMQKLDRFEFFVKIDLCSFEINAEKFKRLYLALHFRFTNQRQLSISFRIVQVTRALFALQHNFTAERRNFIKISRRKRDVTSSSIFRLRRLL